MTLHSTPVTRIRDLHDLLGVIPHLLGFHPAESLVVVVVDDARVQLTARADLAELEGEGHLELLLDRLRLRWPAAGLWVVAYTSSEGRGWRTLERARTHLGDVLAGDPMCVCGGWYRAGDPDGPRLRHDPASTQSAASATLHGLQARPDRGQLRSMVRIEAEQAFEAESAWRSGLERANDLTGSELAHSMALSVVAGLSQPNLLTRDELVWLGLLAAHPTARDRALVAITHENAELSVGLWSRVVRACPYGTQGPALALLGWSAWVSGDGALQCVCLEELDQLGESLHLQRVLDGLNQAIVPPSFWYELRAQMLGSIEPLQIAQVAPEPVSGAVGVPAGRSADDQVA